MSYDCTIQLAIREKYYPDLLDAIGEDYLARAFDEKADGVLLYNWPYDNQGYDFPGALQDYLKNVPEEDFLFHLRDEYENFENMGRFLDNPFGMTQTFTITVGRGFDPVKDFFCRNEGQVWRGRSAGDD